MSKDHLAQCALHPSQVDGLGPSGGHNGEQLGHKDPTEDPHGTHGKQVTIAAEQQMLQEDENQGRIPRHFVGNIMKCSGPL